MVTEAEVASSKRHAPFHRPKLILPPVIDRRINVVERESFEADLFAEQLLLSAEGSAPPVKKRYKVKRVLKKRKKSKKLLGKGANQSDEELCSMLEEEDGFPVRA